MIIYKFPLKEVANQPITLPVGAEILCVHSQRGILTLWAKIDEKWPKVEQRTIEIFGTGHEMNNDARTYIGTVLMYSGDIVWHVFELLKV